MSDIYIGFSPNNFFYVDALNDNAEFAPSKVKCDGIADQTINCDHSHFVDNSFNCLLQEMCKNEKFANSIKNTNHNEYEGEQEKYADDTHSYQNYFLKTVNLGIGIGALIYLMSRNTM